MTGANKKKPAWPHGFAPIAPDPSAEPFSPVGETWWRMKPRKPVAQAPHDSTRILLVEPDAYHRRVLRMLLTAPHASVIEVATGEAAIDLLGFKSFDLIIVAIGDDRAADMHVVKWIRRNPSAWSDMPILGVLGEDDTDGAGRLVTDGLTDWTVKPVRRAELSEKLFALMPALGDLSQPRPVSQT
jgi:DNA-binding response OmpR family regulator